MALNLPILFRWLKGPQCLDTAIDFWLPREPQANLGIGEHRLCIQKDAVGHAVTASDSALNIGVPVKPKEFC